MILRTACLTLLLGVASVGAAQKSPFSELEAQDEKAFVRELRKVGLDENGRRAVLDRVFRDLLGRWNPGHRLREVVLSVTGRRVDPVAARRLLPPGIELAKDGFSECTIDAAKVTRGGGLILVGTVKNGGSRTGGVVRYVLDRRSGRWRIVEGKQVLRF